ncbi:uncharacterized protein [Cardiocondyla obscurior]|uniref:uncharacterized protein isoform X2 n=1 Tax=Cardiocondyla obscurior TaxID=286306 RepID=UPI003965678D
MHFLTRFKRYSSLAEGGPILMSSSRHEATTETNRLDDNKARDNAPKERYASRMGTVVARKGVDEKIKARKGVQEDVASTKSIDQNVAENVETENVSLTRTTLKNTKSIVENNIVNETAHITSETSNVNNTNLNSTNPSHSAGSLNHNINSNASTAHETASLPEITNNVTTPKASTHIEKHIPKPKPTVTTVDGPEINESIPPSRTKNPPLGMPRKVDYIVPVIITIIALPILGAAIVVLYRQGQDCWDKRHYRRMDFLIDGMYND